MASTSPAIAATRKEEWHELQVVLQSGIFNKAPNLRHFLEYVSEQYFAGDSGQVKEYSIAVHALHRQEQFDPQSDAIVRVTAHTLRKKLEQYYATEGADHLIRIRLPAGNYVPQFDRREQAAMGDTDLPGALSGFVESVRDALRTRRSRRVLWVSLAVAGVVALLLLRSDTLRHRQPGSAAGLANPGLAPRTGDSSGSAGAAEMMGEKPLLIRFGPGSNAYVDVSGQTWLSDQSCKGGTAFSHAMREIQGTDDPALFLEGREGKFQCRIRVPPGSYQLQLLFADTAGDKEAARQVDFSINNVVTSALDVVDEAGGDDVVVGKVYVGIHPLNDGTIHLDFTSDGSFVNAAELTRSDSDRGLALRMLAGPAIVHDDQGDTWLPERFFQGGRRTSHAENLPNAPNSRLFGWERYGHFHYQIPVAAGKQYTVKLYFSEGWFGKTNGGPGGIGSRVFDVYCNGTTLLKNFDILKTQIEGTAVVALSHVKPTAHNMLELDFTPVENYALINAIEIEPEN
jgi:hypothetical protein